MAHLKKKKLSLSERFGTIGPVDYQSKACKNSEMVSKLQQQIEDVVRKRSGGNVRESQAQLISEEISDVQQRFDDAPMASQKFKPFKVELKVNIGNKQAMNQNDMNRNARSYSAGRMETLCESHLNNTDNNDRKESVDKVISGTGTVLTAEERKFKNDEHGSMDKYRNNERNLNIQPTFYQDPVCSDGNQKHECDQNLDSKWFQKNSDFDSPQNTARNPSIFQEQQKRHQNKSPENQKTFQSRKQSYKEGNCSRQNNNKWKAKFKKTNDESVQSSNNFSRRQSSNFNKGKGSKTNQNFNKGFNPTQGPTSCSKFNNRPSFQTNPNFNKGPECTGSPDFHNGPGFKTSPHFNNGPECRTSPNFNKGPGCKASPNLNEEKGFHANVDINRSNNIQARQGIQTNPNYQASPNLHQNNGSHTDANNGQCSEVGPNQNNRWKFQASPNMNKGKDFQASPNLNKGPALQGSPGFNQNNVPRSFGCSTFASRNIQDRQNNAQQHYTTDFSASDDPCTIYDMQDQFYNYNSDKRFKRGRQQRANFYNKPGYGGHLKSQQHSFSSGVSHVNQTRQDNPQASANNVVQPSSYTSSEQPHNAGGFGKRHASPVGSNKYMSPAKKRVLATDPLNQDIPSFQNRLPLTNPPWQGNHCHLSSDNASMENQNVAFGYYQGQNLNNTFHPPATGNFGLALHGPFTPKFWHAPTHHQTSNLESIDVHARTENKLHPLNENDDSASTKHYLFNRMLDQEDTSRFKEDVLKPAGDNIKPAGEVKPTGDIVKPSGGIVKPTGFYQEITNEERSGSIAAGHKGKEETELVSTLLTQCQAMAQKDDDRQALHTIFNIIQQEMGNQTSSVKSKIPSADCKPVQPHVSFSDTSLNGDDAKFSPTSSSPDAASKQNGNNQFEGRTLLKGGVKPRHIPKTLVIKQDEDLPRDPRPIIERKNKPLSARKIKDLPLPPFFIEFVATEKFGKKIKDDGKLKQDAEKNTNKVNSTCIPSNDCQTKDVKTDIENNEDLNIESNLGIKQPDVAKEDTAAEVKVEKCGPDTLETKSSGVISHILPRITVRQEQGVRVSDTSLMKNHYVDISSRDPRLRATSISKKRDNNPEVDLLVLKYGECGVRQQHEAHDDVNGKALNCIQEQTIQPECSKERNEVYLVPSLNRDGLQCLQRNSPVYREDINGRETISPKSGHERSSRHYSVPRDISKHFSSGKSQTQQRRYSGSENGRYSGSKNGRTEEIDRFYCDSPPKRYNRLSRERSLSRSRSSSRSRDEAWMEKEITVRRTNTSNFSHRSKCISQSYERNTVMYKKDRHSEHYRNQFRERDEHNSVDAERRSMSPGTFRYLKRRVLERRNTPPPSSHRDRDLYRSHYQGRRNRNYSEGSDYPESCSSPLR